MEKSTVSIGGIFVPLLTILFITLKLTGKIEWSWWWVLAPLWISAVLFVVVIIIIVIIVLIAIFSKK